MAFASYFDCDQPNVRELQQLLTDLGAYAGSITGDFDDDTYQAYRAVCREHKRPISRDESGRLIVTLEDFLALESLRPAVETPAASPPPALVLPKAFIDPEVGETDAAPEEAAAPFSNDVPAKRPAAVKGLPAEPRRVVKTEQRWALNASSCSFTYNVYSDDTCEITGFDPPYDQYSRSRYFPVVPDEIDGFPVVDICKDVFRGKDELREITLPKGITAIYGGMFGSCKSLNSIIIPEGVEGIARQAFYQCGALQSISLPDGILHIGSAAFEQCGALQSVSLPDSLSHIGSSAFYRCRSLVRIEIPPRVTSIEPSTFNTCTALSTVSLPEGIMRIGSDAFSGCDSLTSITLPDSVTHIGSRAFYCCQSLVSIEIPPKVTAIEARTFSYCSTLSSVLIPESVTSIAADSFNNCSPDLIIYGKRGSHAHLFAIENDIRFRSIE